MSRQLLPEVDWMKVQEAFHRTTRSSGDSPEGGSSDNEAQQQQQQQQNASTSSTPIPSPNPDTDVEMMHEDDDSPERTPGALLSRASGILTDIVIGLDQLHPPMAQQIRQDPDLIVELSPSLASPGLHNPPGVSTGESGIVIDTVADPRQRGPDNRLRPPQKCLSCQTTQTPEWRRGPYGPRTLCNACGLTYAKMVRDNNNQNQKSAGTKEPDSTGATTLSLSAPRQTSNAEAGPSYSNRYSGTQPSGSGMPHAGANTRGSPIDVDRQAGSDSSGEQLELDADLERVGDLDLAGDEMDEDDEDEGSERRTTPPTDRSDFTTDLAGPRNGHCGPHSQRKYHPHHG